MPRVLIEYEPKQSMLTFDFNDLGTYAILPLQEKVEKEGKEEQKVISNHQFELTVTDNRGNPKVVSYQFQR